MHFEELWEKCENFHKENSSLVIDNYDFEELIIKLNLYRNFSSKKDLPEKNLKLFKHRLMGEILFILTKISLKDDVNTYAALDETLQFKSIEKL